MKSVLEEPCPDCRASFGYSCSSHWSWVASPAQHPGHWRKTKIWNKWRRFRTPRVASWPNILLPLHGFNYYLLPFSCSVPPQSGRVHTLNSWSGFDPEGLLLVGELEASLSTFSTRARFPESNLELNIMLPMRSSMVLGKRCSTQGSWRSPSQKSDTDSLFAIRQTVGDHADWMLQHKIPTKKSVFIPLIFDSRFVFSGALALMKHILHCVHFA